MISGREMFISEVKRIMRLHPPEAQPDKIYLFVDEYYMPKFTRDKLDYSKADPDEVESIVLNHFQTSLRLLSNKNRKRKIMLYRKAYCFFMYFRTRLTLQMIGDRIGRDHSSVIHLRDGVFELIEKNEDLHREFSIVNDLINNSLPILESQSTANEETTPNIDVHADGTCHA